MATIIDELAPASAESGRFFGKYRGTVADNDDPEQQGRLRARVPEVLHDVETGWALPCAPYAARGAGLYAVPPVNAGVWIEFEAGDPSRPIWSGCYWTGRAIPRAHDGADSSPARKVLRSEEGLLVALDDDGRTIAVSDASGANLLLVDVGGGTITLRATTKVVVHAAAIQLVENATHPIVFGDDLLSYLGQLVTQFNAHVHPGQMAGPIPVTPAPPQAPWTPPSPALLSTIVTAG